MTESASAHPSSQQMKELSLEQEEPRNSKCSQDNEVTC